jgi:threonine dehydratase
MLNPDERARGVIAASAGNHAQGVSYHAGRHGIRARIFMPLPTPLTKVSATRSYGAEVILHGANYDEAYEMAVEQSQQDRLVLIHAFDDDAVIAGQGTLGLEILQQHPDIEAIVAPIGGGGLIGGIACAVKETNPKVQVFGVQPAKIPSMKAAVAAGKPVTLDSAKTIADGIAVRRAGERTLPLVQKYVDDIATVEEEEIANAILLLLEREKTLAEGAGAAAIAAVLNRKLPLLDKRAAVLVCGGNIDVTLLSRIIERGLVKDGRLVRLRVHLPDYPGALHRLTGILADHRANIVETAYDRAYHGVNLGDTAIDITMETRGPEHISELLAALVSHGYTHERIL